MKRALCNLFTLFASVFLIVVLLFSALQWAINDRSWFYREYEKLDVARGMGMENADVTASALRLVDYMENRVEDIALTVTVNGETTEMFNARETAHMRDVQTLYLNFRSVRNACAVATALLIATVLVIDRRGVRRLAKGFLWTNLGVVALLGGLGLWIARDFSSFWVRFHHVFFTNDLWQLDPATSRMINMCPQQLFYDVILRMGAAFLIVWGALLIASILALALKKRKAADV